MKKRIIIILLLALALILFISCTNDSNNGAAPGRAAPDAVENPLRAAMTDADGNIDLSRIYLLELDLRGFQKFNVLTGSRSPVCPDPLCGDEFHASWSDCVFSGISMMTAAGEWLYFPRNTSVTAHDKNYNIISTTSTGAVCAYNLVTREFKVLYSVSDIIGQNVAFQRLFHYRDGYIYLRRQAYDPKTDDYDLWSLIRVNADTGRDEVIVDATPGEYVAGVGDVLVFEDRFSVRGETTIYKTDMSYQNRVDLITVQGLAGVYHRLKYENYIYFSHYVAAETGPRRFTISRVDIQTGEISKVAELPSAAITPFLIGDWIYYLLQSDSAKGVIHRVSAAGGEPEVYYEDSDFDFMWADGVGQHVVITYRGESGDWSNKIVIDTETGERMVY
jgi:hypothetical protein